MNIAQSSTPQYCSHCNLPLPPHPHAERQADRTLWFCCAGCLFVYRLIGSEGESGRAAWFLARLGLAALLSGNIMMFQTLLYFWSPEQLGPDVLRTSSWIMLVCALAVYVLLGLPMLSAAGRAALRGQVSLETLIGLGALAAIGFSAVETFRGGHQLYYDSGTMLLVIVTLGQYLDAEARRKALAALTPTVARVRRSARLLRDGVALTLPPEQLRAGDRVEVHAGEEIPTDGRIVEGYADVQESTLTGEWRPRSVGPGDPVFAGSTTLDGALTVLASGQTQTLADRVAQWTNEARSRKAPIEAVANRVVAFFIPTVGMVAGVCLLTWGIMDSWLRGLQAALSVLVIACPCALGIATPLATTLALYAASRRGVLVRSGAALEALARVKTIAFDKTGTLTAGHPSLREIWVPEPKHRSAPDSLTLAAAVESRVNHPFARAIVDYVSHENNRLPRALDVHAVPGSGAAGTVCGHTVLVGSRSWLDTRGVSAASGELQDADGSVVGIAVDGTIAGEIVLEDPVRPEARDTLKSLLERGIACHLLSGDRASVVSRVARRTGCATYAAELGPDEKPVALQALRQGGSAVAMVGDGVNDAPALAAADVGIAFGYASELARVNADIIVLRDDLREIVGVVDLSRRTLRIIKQNLAWAFGYNSIGVVVAAMGALRPVLAAAAMVLSSVFVIANSMRLRRSG